MKYLFVLSGEHASLPAAEASGLFRTLDPDIVVNRLSSRLMLIETTLDPDIGSMLSSRLSLTREASEVIQMGLTPNLGNLSTEIFNLVKDASFLVRARGMGAEGPGIEARMGSIILENARSLGHETSVSLDSPQVTLLLTRNSGELMVSKLIEKQNRSDYEARTRELPFKQPVSLDPVLARAMVNISGVAAGDAVLDPFCGTGIILGEAGAVGARIFGMDFSQSMVEGTATNLRSLGLMSFHLVRGDAMRTPEILGMQFDHVVTDPPYGRASATIRGPAQILAEFPAIMEQAISPGGTLCFASPSTMDLCSRISEAGLRVECFAYQRVHGSLGRHLYLASKV
ncbi:MAG: methyltransferase domain-containing protein [Theionarchaea archaeon]|nr:methyltransferase domain-containing protein [Theionarchaea archaeon]